MVVVVAVVKDAKSLSDWCYLSTVLNCILHKCYAFAQHLQL